jgi:hypothetical protein
MCHNSFSVCYFTVGSHCLSSSEHSAALVLELGRKAAGHSVCFLTDSTRCCELVSIQQLVNLQIPLL